VLLNKRGTKNSTLHGRLSTIYFPNH